MGLIAKIRELFSAERYILQAMEEQDRQNRQYATLSPAELLELPDAELYSAVLYRMDEAIRAGLPKKADPADRAKRLELPRRAVYVVSELDWEMQEGGLRAFFLDDTRVLAAQVGESLREIGAQQHLALFEAFVLDHRVNLARPRGFAQDPEYDAVIADFDRAYHSLPPLSEIAIGYIRRRPEDF